MRRLQSFLIAGLFALSGGSVTWAQSTSAEQQFTAYHQMLTGMADNLLAVPPVTAREFVTPAPPAKAQNSGSTSAIARVRHIRPPLEPILREEGVPTKLAAVVLVESGGRPTALSLKGARGLWQLMPETARRYGLTVTPERDERLDPLKSTRAAARYLRDLYVHFGDWMSALAAYNAGEQLVGNLLRKANNPQFEAINQRLPSETRRYVPAVLDAVQRFESPLPAQGEPRSGKVLYAVSGDEAP